MNLILQIWGGLFYLTNKILFAFSEGKPERKKMRISGWIIYILGVPAWVIILISHQDWIAASIEAGGIPAMLLGLYNTLHNNKNKNLFFNKVVTICTYLSLFFGLLYSLIQHGGITSTSQILEIGVMLGFLLGSYLIAKNSSSGWFFFMLMNISMASLMMLQGKSILMIQQLVSLFFVIYGFKRSLNNPKRMH